MQARLLQVFIDKAFETSHHLPGGECQEQKAGTDNTWWGFGNRMVVRLLAALTC